MNINNSSKIFGYLFLSVISLCYGFNNTKLEITGISSMILLGIAFLLFILFFILQNCYTLNELFKIIILLLLGILSYIGSRSTVFIIMIMVSIVFTKIDFRSGFRLIFIERLLFLFLICFLSLFNILSNNMLNIVKGGTYQEVIAFSLGFNHPNQLAYNVGMLALLYLCYKGKRIKQREIYLTLAIEFGFYLITKTRTLLIVSIFVYLFLEIYLIGQKNTKIRAKITSIWKYTPYVMPACALLSLILPFFMSTANGRFKEILYSLNGLIGSRFTHSARVFDLYSIPLWGGVNEFGLLQSVFSYSVVDNGYLCLLYSIGLILFIVYLIMYYISIKELVVEREYVFIISIMAISIWGITENILRSFAINFTVAFWALCIVRSSQLPKVSTLKIKMRKSRIV